MKNFAKGKWVRPTLLGMIRNPMTGKQEVIKNKMRLRDEVNNYGRNQDT
jgi:hypothetical protein